jgi:DNA-binding CsgD family transcriptional regulator
MARASASGSREGKVTLAILEALGSSLDLHAVLDSAYPLLLQLVSADSGALGISWSGRPEDFEWIVARIPPAFFAAYPEMIRHDFVRPSVAARPNVVLLDEDMASRSELEANIMYRHARDVGAPVEQVMGVMLHADDGWQSGLTLFRDRRRPFSAHERGAMQRVVPAIANAVRNCHRLGVAARWGTALETLLGDRGESIVLLTPPATEVARTTGAGRLIDKWFAPHEMRAGALPEPLATLVAHAMAFPPGSDAPAKWTKRGADATLQASFFLLPERLGTANAMLLLQELPHHAPIPRVWQAALTPREKDVSAAVARGWSNRVIATELGCREATVKKHIQNIFDKLGVASRTALIAQAAQSRRG